MYYILVITSCLVYVAKAMYGGSDVVELTPANFDKNVMKSDELWLIEFYAPWCGHCQRLTPEWKKAATALKGVVKIAAVDADAHRDLGGRYQVQGFPTIKVFGLNKNSPTDYQGAREAQGIVDAALREASSMVKQKLSGKRGSGGGGSGGSGKKSDPADIVELTDANFDDLVLNSEDMWLVELRLGMKALTHSHSDPADVVELTDANFDDLVLNSEDMWLVEFFAPWCGHCKNLAPHWEQAATELKGKFKLGAVDATVHTVKAGRFGVRGYPTIKFFPGGKKDMDSAQDYDGGRTSSDIVNWALDKVKANLPPPEVYEVTSQEVLDTTCEGKQLCVVSVLPHILDCQSKCRNEYIAMLKKLGDRFKEKGWGWLWAEGGSQPKLEESLEIGGFGYPAMAAFNSKKKVFSILRSSFDESGIREFLRNLGFGKGTIIPLRGLPKCDKTEPWDGKDGVMPEEEDIDLSDVVLDDIKDEL